MPAILLPCTTGTGFPSSQGHSQTHGCDVPPIPCLDPVLPPELPPQVLLTPSMSHPTRLQPSVLQGRGRISLPPFDGLWQIAGARQIAVPAKNHHCCGAGAGSITHIGNCICLCEKGLGAAAASLTLLQASGDMAQPTSPLATYSRERHGIRHSPSPRHPPTNTQKSEYLYTCK